MEGWTTLLYWVSREIFPHFPSEYTWQKTGDFWISVKKTSFACCFFIASNVNPTKCNKRQAYNGSKAKR
jgi:hypothetical protein